MRVVGIVAPLPHRGQFSGKICIVEKPGVQYEWGRHASKRSSEPRLTYPEVKVQVRDLVRVVGIVAPFGPRGAVFGKKLFLSRNPGYQTRVVAMWLNVALSPGLPTQKSKFRYGTWCELWALLPSLPSGGPLFGISSFYRASVGKWAQKTCALCPQQRYTTVEPGKVHGRKRVGIVEESSDTGPEGSVFGENLFCRETRGTKRVGVAMRLNVVLTPG